jgi:pentatricopeptide repeat protein
LKKAGIFEVRIIQCNNKSDIFLDSSLDDMHAKCGSLEDTWRVFNKMPIHDMVSWTTMLGGYAMHGQGKEALRHFEQMCEKGVEIDKIAFISLLSACSHADLVDEGLHYFESLLHLVYVFLQQLSTMSALLIFLLKLAVWRRQVI